ncbi:hypothetical protein [Campylobacter geochelonis]|uniref:HTH HARE-type domain-containing protein n=1 Tax=Campylobacter geochelonis TaxID=1780362 RepID=A0A128EBG6_9BACT|nr:hypothetical protein [Campylobacter geochelonis]QKF70416.1 type II restriction endonuclease [Campylobacter geochelonis]CZE46336.1 Uncharacterised protein [Campylobacter geochelonis]
MTIKDLTYSEAIEKVMLNNGYFAPLKLIYREIWNYKNRSGIKGKTPDYTIQERVQRDTKFTKIGLGIYALTEFLDKLPQAKAPITKQDKQENRHANIQGMLLEIGNHQKDIFDTYTNDKSWIFENKTLGSLATLNKIPPFTFENIISDSVSFLDVVWFNERRFPQVIFEVEHSTDFRGAFVKFMELQDFQTRFYCVANKSRLSKFKKEIDKVAFLPIKKRVKFLTYEQVESDYYKAIKRDFIKY